MPSADDERVKDESPVVPIYRALEWSPHIPAPWQGQTNAHTHGVTVAGDGRVIIFSQANPAVVRSDVEGDPRDTRGSGGRGAHGLMLARESKGEMLWLTDQGTGEAVKTTLDGEKLMQLEAPPGPVYGDVREGEGRGMSYAHRDDRACRYLKGITGKKGEAFGGPAGSGATYGTTSRSPAPQTAGTAGCRCTIRRGPSNVAPAEVHSDARRREPATVRNSTSQSSAHASQRSTPTADSSDISAATRACVSVWTGQTFRLATTMLVCSTASAVSPSTRTARSTSQNGSSEAGHQARGAVRRLTQPPPAPTYPYHIN